MLVAVLVRVAVEVGVCVAVEDGRVVIVGGGVLLAAWVTVREAVSVMVGVRVIVRVSVTVGVSVLVDVCRGVTVGGGVLLALWVPVRVSVALGCDTPAVTVGGGVDVAAPVLGCSTVTATCVPLPALVCVEAGAGEPGAVLSASSGVALGKISALSNGRLHARALTSSAATTIRARSLVFTATSMGRSISIIETFVFDSIRL